MSSKIVISDSGSITEEAAILNLPAISLREDIERQEGMDNGVLIMSDIEKNDLSQKIDLLIETKSRLFPLIPKDYSVENVSDKVVRIIASYVSYINRKVWKKNRIN